MQFYQYKDKTNSRGNYNIKNCLPSKNWSVSNLIFDDGRFDQFSIGLERSLDWCSLLFILRYKYLTTLPCYKFYHVDIFWSMMVSMIIWHIRLGVLMTLFANDQLKSHKNDQFWFLLIRLSYQMSLMKPSVNRPGQRRKHIFTFLTFYQNKRIAWFTE